MDTCLYKTLDVFILAFTRMCLHYITRLMLMFIQLCLHARRAQCIYMYMYMCTYNNFSATCHSTSTGKRMTVLCLV